MEFGEEDEQSRTVTIALDSPSSADDGPRKDKFEEGENARMGQEEEEEGEREFGLDDHPFCAIPAPPSPSDLLATWRNFPSEVAPQLRNLSPAMAQLLEQRLNAPSCGSMRNWEFLAANLGLGLDELVQLRRMKNPMGALMRRFGQEPLLRLLELIGEAGRIDVLISVRHLARKTPTIVAKPGPDHHLALDSAMLSSVSASTSLARSIPGPGEQFILLLHHEHRDNHNLRKFHRLLAKNLDLYARQEGIRIVDVDKCMAEEDLVGSVGRHFERAQQVVMALSPDYADLTSIDQRMAEDDQNRRIDQRDRMKLYLHQMTFNEVILNGNQNRRFRVVLMQGCRPEHIPRGWPSNTLHYRFPPDFEALCQRLFESRK